MVQHASPLLVGGVGGLAVGLVGLGVGFGTVGGFQVGGGGLVGAVGILVGELGSLSHGSSLPHEPAMHLPC